MSDLTGGKACDNEDSASESSFGSSAVCCGGDATRWFLLGFQVEVESQDQQGAKQILQINDAADCSGSLDLTCMKCDKRVSVAKHLHNLSPYSLHSMIAISAKAWHALLYLVTPWQYLPRLGMLLYILSRLGSICWGSVWGLACSSISCHTLAVSSGAWYAILYLVTPLQYLLGLGMLFYILSRLDSICLGLLHALLYLITPWQYLLGLGMLFYILSRLGSIRRRTNLQKPKLRKLKSKLKEQ